MEHHLPENGFTNGNNHPHDEEVHNVNPLELYVEPEILVENHEQDVPMLIVHPPEQLDQPEGILNPGYIQFNLDDEDESSSSSENAPPTVTPITARNGHHHQPDKEHKRIPIYIVEDHHHVVEFIHENIRKRFLPVEGNTLIHFDSHPDMLIPKQMPADSAYEPQELYEHHDIENWIMPNCYTGIFHQLVWVKPPWANQIKTRHQKLYIGKCKTSQTIRLESSENYFISEGLFQLRSELENVRTVTLDCLTLGNRIVQSGDDIGQMKAISENNDKNPTVLDIDLDFFSTQNPFLSLLYEADVYSRLRSVFKFTPPLSNCDNHILDAQLRRIQQLDELEKLFKHIKQFRKMPEFDGAEPTQMYKEVSLILDAVNEQYPNANIDWDSVYAAGCTIDDHELPHHVSTNAEIEILLQSLENFLETFMQPPLIITISRSSNDDYTPRNQVEYIQARVLEVLNRRFKCAEPVIAYTERVQIEPEPSPASSEESTLSTTSLTSDESMKEPATAGVSGSGTSSSNAPSTPSDFSDPQPGPSHR